MKKETKISIIIPVKNGVSTLPDCIEGIQRQTLFPETEIVIIDSGSTDGTLELLANYPEIELHQILPEKFNHGATRNTGIKLAKGEFVVMTVQDAIAADQYWLENMLRHFADPEIAGVCGQQIVPHHKDKNPHNWFRPQSLPKFKKIQFTRASDFDALSPAEKKKSCGWDNVTVMYRKTALVEIPFQPVMFGEDMLWAKEALSKGLALVYDSSTRVEHYHHNTPSFTYNRTMAVWLFTYKTFGLVREKPAFYRDFLLVIYRNLKWGSNPKWIWHNWKIIWYTRKAIKDFKKSFAGNQLDDVEKELSQNVPQGNANRNMNHG